MNSAGTDYVSAICARDYKGLSDDDITSGKAVIVRKLKAAY